MEIGELSGETDGGGGKLIEKLIRWAVARFMPLYHIKKKPVRKKLL